MSFDKTQPTDTTKIRNLGTVIRPNWVAIEEADSSFEPYAMNYQTRNDLAVPNDPAAISGDAIVYCKDDSSGNAQLYCINENSDIFQLTGGSQTEASKGHILFPGGIKINWGTIVSTANTPKSETFDSAFTSAVYSITLTPLSDTGSGRTAVIDTTTSPTTAGFSIRSTNNGMSVYYMAIGK